MRKKISLIIIFSIFLTSLGVYFHSRGDGDSQSTFWPLHLDMLKAGNEAPPVQAKRELYEQSKKGFAPSEASAASSTASNFEPWTTGFSDVFKETLQAASSRRAPVPPKKYDIERQKILGGGGNQQESPTGSIAKATPRQKQNVAPGIMVDCNLSRPSCRRWLHLQKKKLRRKKALAVNKTSE